MNKVELIGRLTRDPDIRHTQGDNPITVARYTLAVDRRYKKDGEQEADFIVCKAFGRAAEFAEKYLHQGIKIAVIGRIQTGSYTKDDTKVYTTEVIAEEQEFVESKNKNSAPKGQESSEAPATDDDGFMTVPDDAIESEIPFR